MILDKKKIIIRLPNPFILGIPENVQGYIFFGIPKMVPCSNYFDEYLPCGVNRSHTGNLSWLLT